MDTRGRAGDRTGTTLVRVGQSVGLGLFVLSLIAGVLMFIMFEQPTDLVYETANETLDNQTARQGIENSQTIFEALPIIFIAVGSVGTLAWAVYSSDIP